MTRWVAAAAGAAAMLASGTAEARLTRFVVVERATAAGYPDWVILRRVRAAAEMQVPAGWLLRDDAVLIVSEAEASDVLR